MATRVYLSAEVNKRNADSLLNQNKDNYMQIWQNIFPTYSWKLTNISVREKSHTMATCDSRSSENLLHLF